MSIRTRNPEGRDQVELFIRACGTDVGEGGSDSHAGTCEILNQVPVPVLPS